MDTILFSKEKYPEEYQEYEDTFKKLHYPDLKVKISRILDTKLIPDLTDIVLEYYKDVEENNNIDYLIYTSDGILPEVATKLEIVKDLLKMIIKIHDEHDGFEITQPRFTMAYQSKRDNRPEFMLRFTKKKFKKLIKSELKYKKTENICYEAPIEDIMELRKLIDSDIIDNDNGICFKRNLKYSGFDCGTLLLLRDFYMEERLVPFECRIVNSGHLRVMVVECM